MKLQEVKPTTTKKDALGNPIIFGNRYGYSVDFNGTTRVKAGIALRETPKGMISLQLDYNIDSGHGDNRSTPTGNKLSSAKSVKLFPLRKDLSELTKMQDSLIWIYTCELVELSSFAQVYGWKSSRIKEAYAIRDNIKLLKSTLKDT